MGAIKAKQLTKSIGECGGTATATAVPLSLPASPAAAPAQPKWVGRLSKLPVQLQQFLLPFAEPHLAKLQTGEIQKSFVFVPKIGSFTLERKGKEIWVIFQDALVVAYQRLQMLRTYAVAVRYKTIAQSPQNGYWFWLPQQSIFSQPAEFCVLLEYVSLGSLQERSPPPWENNLSSTYAIDMPLFVGSRYITPATPRAIRAPTALPIKAGAAGRFC